MRIFVDIDGTLTTQQRRRSWWRAELRPAVIAAVKRHYDAGDEIILWTGTTSYAKAVAKELAEKHGIVCGGAVGKPDLIVDNQDRRLARRLAGAIVTPEAFETQEAWT